MYLQAAGFQTTTIADGSKVEKIFEKESFGLPETEEWTPTHFIR